MTVTADALARKDYTGDGANKTFAYDFRILSNTHLSVYVDSVAKVLTTDYTVTGVGDAGGGNVVFITAPASSTKVAIVRNIPFEQTTDYQESSAFPAETHEQALDKLTMLLQQAWEAIRRAVKLDIGKTDNDKDFPSPKANEFIRWNAAGNALETAVPAALATSLGGTPVATSTSPNDEGVSTTASKSDHRHEHGSHDHTATARDGGVLTNDEHDGYLQIAESAAPAAGAADKHRMFMDSADSTLKLKKDGGSLVVLEPTAPVGYYGSIGQTSKNNAVTPNTQFDLDADTVILRAVADGIVVRFNPGAAITNDIGVAGPAVNGRDQAAAFAASSWIHFYWIWNGTTLATVSSLTAPPTGPVFPTGYTHWSYAGAVRLDGAGILLKTRIFGNTAFYEALQNAANADPGTTETAISLAAFIPPNASRGIGHAQFVGDVSAPGTINLLIRLITTVNWMRIVSRANNGTAEGHSGNSSLDFPNISQNLYYLFDSAVPLSRNVKLDILGYVLPNGGS